MNQILCLRIYDNLSIVYYNNPSTNMYKVVRVMTMEGGRSYQIGDYKLNDVIIAGNGRPTIWAYSLLELVINVTAIIDLLYLVLVDGRRINCNGNDILVEDDLPF